eukprot:scaffold1878_cov113-Isochrysis_galbana.AAC.15
MKCVNELGPEKQNAKLTRSQPSQVSPMPAGALRPANRIEANRLFDYAHLRLLLFATLRHQPSACDSDSARSLCVTGCSLSRSSRSP